MKAFPMAAQYSRHGMEFLYPDNWRVSDGGDSEIQSHWVSLESPSTGCWTVHRYPSVYRAESVVEELVAGMETEYPEMERGPFQRELAEISLTGQQAYFYYLDLLVRWQVFSTVHQDQVFVLEWQAEDQEFDELQRVFEAVTTSLFSATGPSAEDSPAQAH